jgi:hypothetical protein
VISLVAQSIQVALALPAWLGWLSATAGAVHLVVPFGIVLDSGPLAPGGALTYVAYLLMVAWLLTTTIVVIRRTRP